MKKKVKKVMVILGASLILFTSTIDARADKVNLKKYKTDQNIMLNGSPIMIPKKSLEMEEEYRGVWVSTVFNLDFPSKKGISQEEYKKEYLKILDNVEDLNMNSIIFQVRPKGDAFYQSDINPWSEYLTGKQGVSPGWDPMEWMVEETHKRGIEFQAWFNPYRVDTAVDHKSSKGQMLAKLSGNNWARKNPQHVLKYGGKLYLNPGNPEVIDYIDRTIMEVVNKYDIDAVHLDDYFYPNKSLGDVEKFYSSDEKISYEKYGKDFNNLADWRRDNVNKLVKRIHDSLETYNMENQDHVEFGISPFGIWAPDSRYPGQGSKTPASSLSSYDNQFVDTRKWVREGWLDYIAPQIYWTFDSKAAPYGVLVDWWSNLVKDTDVNLYIGHANYKKAENNAKSSWGNPKEISNQLKFNDTYDEIKGDIFFRYKNLLKDEKANTINNQFIDILKNNHYNKQTKAPAKKIQENLEIESPKDLEVTRVDNTNRLTWKDSKENPSKYYLVYREEIKGSEDGNKEIIGRVLRGDKIFNHFIDSSLEAGRSYRYSVSSVDKGHRESELIIGK